VHGDLFPLVLGHGGIEGTLCGHPLRKLLEAQAQVEANAIRMPTAEMLFSREEAGLVPIGKKKRDRTTEPPALTLTGAIFTGIVVSPSGTLEV